MSKYIATAVVTVEVEIDDDKAPDAIIRCTENINGWREEYYTLLNMQSVIEHWAWNAVANGVEDVSRLDGWADIAEGAVRVTVMHCELEDIADASE